MCHPDHTENHTLQQLNKSDIDIVDAVCGWCWCCRRRSHDEDDV